jgi:hypothetical protein
VSISYAAKSLIAVARWATAVSTKLSIAVVIGVGTLPLLPQAASTTPSSVEVLRAKPVPLVASQTPVPLLATEDDDATFQLAARRPRAKRAPEPEPEEEDTPPANRTSAISQPEPPQVSEPASKREEVAAKAGVPPNNKTSMIAPPEPPKTPVAPDKPAEAAEAEPPKPDVWSDEAVIAALRECVKLLGPIAAEVEVSPPVKSEQCGAPAAVLLRRVGSGANKVEINPPAMLNCAMVATLHGWVEKTLQPAAQASFGAPIARLRSASGYACRNRNGSRSSIERLSEHALANAIDIAGFVTADGRSIDVARFWGPTRRDEREAERVAAARTKEGKPEPEKAEPARDEAPRDRKISAIAPAAAIQAKATDRVPLHTAELRKVGRGTSDISADPKAVPATGNGDRAAVEKSAEAAFLRQLHKGACGVFGTVLGPEANEAHRDHFHFDLAHRRSKAFCE